jgi:hypothetical protein
MVQVFSGDTAGFLLLSGKLSKEQLNKGMYITGFSNNKPEDFWGEM